MINFFTEIWDPTPPLLGSLYFLVLFVSHLVELFASLKRWIKSLLKQAKLSLYFWGCGGHPPNDSNPEQDLTSQFGKSSMFFTFVV